MKAGPAAHKETVRRARKAEEVATRREKAWGYLLADCTFAQIGRLCGVSNYTAWQDCVAVLKNMEHGPAEAALMLAQTNGQIAALIRTHWPKKHEKASADVILRALERKAKLNGLDRQREELITPDEHLRQLRRVIAVFLEVEQDMTKRRELVMALRRQLPGGADVVDVPPPPRPDEQRDAND